LLIPVLLISATAFGSTMHGQQPDHFVVRALFTRLYKLNSIVPVSATTLPVLQLPSA
jgi:hypothetical protein